MTSSYTSRWSTLSLQLPAPTPRRDVAYTSPQLSSLLSSSLLHPSARSEPRARVLLDLRARASDPLLLSTLAGLGTGEQEEVAELVSGAVTKHSLYLTREEVRRVERGKRVCIMGGRKGLGEALEGRRMGGWKEVVGERLEEGGVWRRILGALEEHNQCKKTMEEVGREVGLGEEEVVREVEELISFTSLTGRLLVRGEGVTPSPLSLRHHDLFQKFYSIYE